MLVFQPHIEGGQRAPQSVAARFEICLLQGPAGEEGAHAEAGRYGGQCGALEIGEIAVDDLLEVRKRAETLDVDADLQTGRERNEREIGGVADIEPQPRAVTGRVQAWFPAGGGSDGHVARGQPETL